MPAFPHFWEAERVSVIPLSDNERLNLIFVMVAAIIHIDRLHHLFISVEQTSLGL